VGALVPEKDPATQVRVGAEMLRRDPGAVLLIVGDGPLRGSVERQASSLGLDGRLQLLGSRVDVPDLLAASDVLLLASRADGMEGMPGVVIEAALAGIPAAAYAVPGIPELIRDGETGMVVRPGRPASLLSAAARLMSEAHLRQEMGTAARAWCQARFTIDRIAPLYLEVYRRVLEGEGWFRTSS